MTYSSDRSESGSRALLACPLPFSAAPKLSLCLPTQRGGFGPAAQAWSELDRPGVQWGPCQVCTVHIVSEASEARWGWGSPEDPWNPVHSNPGQVGAGPGSHFESHGSCEQSMSGVGGSRTVCPPPCLGQAPYGLESIPSPYPAPGPPLPSAGRTAVL